MYIAYDKTGNSINRNNWYSTPICAQDSQAIEYYGRWTFFVLCTLYSLPKFGLYLYYKGLGSNKGTRLTQTRRYLSFASRRVYLFLGNSPTRVN